MSTDPVIVIHSELPREGPGSLASTSRALFAVPELPHAPRILDLGCGTGAQTLDLARLLPDASITALDCHEPFLDVLRRRAEAEGFEDRITTVQGDLAHPPEDEVDLVWSEGAAYFMGFANMLHSWPALLARGGAIAVTELVQLVDPLPEAARAVWQDAYPDLQPIDVRRAQIVGAGLVLHDVFVLDPETTWRPFYDAVQARIDVLRPHADAAMTEALDASQAEVDAFWGHPGAVGYAFFVFGRPDRDEVSA